MSKNKNPKPIEGELVEEQVVEQTTDDSIDAEFSEIVNDPTVKPHVDNWIKNIFANFNMPDAIKGAMKVNKEQAKEVLAERLTHAIVEGTIQTFLHLIPDEHQARKFLSSGPVKGLLYVTFMQGLNIAATHLYEEDDKLMSKMLYISKGCARNSINQVLDITKIAERLKNLHPLIKELFED